MPFRECCRLQILGSLHGGFDVRDAAEKMILGFKDGSILANIARHFEVAQIRAKLFEAIGRVKIDHLWRCGDVVVIARTYLGCSSQQARAVDWLSATGISTILPSTENL